MASKKPSSNVMDDAGSSAGGATGFFARMAPRGNANPKSFAPAASSKEALALLQNFEESGRGWFWATDAEGRITYLSESVCGTFGREPGEVIGTSFIELFRKSDDPDDLQRTLPFLFTRQSKFDDLPLQPIIGESEMWWAVSGRPYRTASGEFAGFRGSGTDVTAQRRSTRDNNRLAKYDSLTGLINRFQMTKLLETTLTAFQVQRRPCSIMLIDLDRFKHVNDTLGHPVGDALLKTVAERLVKVVGDRERVARLGGDEFQIILPDMEDRGALGDLADNIIKSISQPYLIEGSRCIIGASVGVAVSPFDGESSEQLVRNADLALYAAKGGGRGRFRFYASELLQTAEDRRLLEDDLRDAVVNRELWLAYQPVVDVTTNMVKGFEALVRWNHPERGPISPALFIPIAEEANLVGDIGEWAIRRACDEAANWPGKLTVAVNVSPIQFTNDLLPKIVENALSASGLAPERLELELTEGVFLQESADTDTMFKALKKLKVRLALDDFGTGYSSLGYLRTAPFDKIKIDQSFVRDATEPGSRNGAIIKAIVALAEALEMDVTAEGIETLDQLELIRNLDVRYVQGYVFSHPLSNEDLLQSYSAGEWHIEPSGPAVQRPDRLSMYRKVGVVHDNHYYRVMLRNLSVGGALIEGIIDVPAGTEFVLDLGDGQLAPGKVVRSMGHQQGVEFGERLVNDGNGSYCTSRRIPPYILAAAGLPLEALPPGYYDNIDRPPPAKTIPAFATLNDWKKP
jgi:diguanylate cyclase (GGDEF)-like protein/PAS domain S-box-containing protein